MFKKAVLLVQILIFSFVSNAQKKLQTTALNRITFIKNDTLYVFFVLKPGEKFKPKSSGNFHWFRPDTILITNSGFGGKLLNGEYKVFYPNKNIKESGFFDHGLKTGEWREWDIEGRLLKITNWKNGFREGNFIIYDKDGIKINEGYYSKDTIHVSNKKK